MARQVARVLRRAGAPLATTAEAGVVLRVREDGAVEVRWAAPRGAAPRSVPLFELERCVVNLRAGGIRATLFVDDTGPWIVCPPRA